MAEKRSGVRFTKMSGGQGDDALGMVDNMIDGRVSVEGGLQLKDLTQAIGGLFRGDRPNDPVNPTPAAAAPEISGNEYEQKADKVGKKGSFLSQIAHVIGGIF